MIIGACGFGSTGSSVITDYLKEFDEIIVKDDLEFTYVSGVDGLIDLERAVMNPHNRTADSITAIKRFMELVDKKKKSYKSRGLDPVFFVDSAQKFIDAITMAKWYNYSNSVFDKKTIKYYIANYLKNKIIPKLEIKRGARINRWPKTEVRLSVKPENFYDLARKHVEELLTAMGLDCNRTIAFDQPFAGNNPQSCFPYFIDPYAIVVDRDPRDNYVFAKTKLLGKFNYIPIDTVEDYIAYYRCLRKDQPYLETNSRILNIRFEDMVYEYESTSKKIRDFLHLPDNPRPKSVFDPALSIANTQVFKRFPQFADDVKKIEEQLPEYLFDFSKYPEPDFSKKMFYGVSPLHEKFKQSFFK
jgi:hypothetical protein